MDGVLIIGPIAFFVGAGVCYYALKKLGKLDEAAPAVLAELDDAKAKNKKLKAENDALKAQLAAANERADKNAAAVAGK